MTEAVEQGKIIQMNKFAKSPKNMEENTDTSRKSYEMHNQDPITGPKPYKLPHQIEEQSELKKTMSDIETPVANPSNKEEKDSTISEMIIHKETNKDIKIKANVTNATSNIKVSEEPLTPVSNAHKVTKNIGVEKTKHEVHQDLNNKYIKKIPTILRQINEISTVKQAEENKED